MVITRPIVGTLTQPLAQGLTPSTGPNWPPGTPDVSSYVDLTQGVPSGWTYTGPSLAYHPEDPRISGAPVRDSSKGLFLCQPYTRLNENPVDMDASGMVFQQTLVNDGPVGVTLGPFDQGVIGRGTGGGTTFARLQNHRVAGWNQDDWITISTWVYGGMSDFSNRSRLRVVDGGSLQEVTSSPITSITERAAPFGPWDASHGLDFGSDFYRLHASFQSTTMGATDPILEVGQFRPSPFRIGIMSMQIDLAGMYLGPIVASPTTQSVTRAADNLSSNRAIDLPASANGAWSIRIVFQTHGTEVNTTDNQFGPVFQLSQAGTNANRLMAFPNKANGALRVDSRIGGVIVDQGSLIADSRGMGRIALVMSYDGAGTIRSVATGTAVRETANIGSFPALDTLYIGRDGPGTNHVNTFVESVATWQEGLSGPVMEALV